MSKQLATVQAERERYHDCLRFLQETGVSLNGKTICQSDLHLIVFLEQNRTSYDIQIVLNQQQVSTNQDPRQKPLAQQDLFYATRIGYMIEEVATGTTLPNGLPMGYGTYMTCPNVAFFSDSPDFNHGVAQLWNKDMFWNNMSMTVNVTNVQVIRNLAGARFRYVPQSVYDWVPGVDPDNQQATLLTQQEEEDGFVDIVPALVVDGALSTTINLTFTQMPIFTGSGITEHQYFAHVFLRGFLAMNCAGNNAGSDAARVLMALEAARGGLPTVPVASPMGTVIPGMPVNYGGR